MDARALSHKPLLVCRRVALLSAHHVIRWRAELCNLLRAYRRHHSLL